MRYTRLPRAGSPLFPSARPTLLVTSIILIMTLMMIMMIMILATQPYHDKSDLTCQSKWFGELFPDLLGNSCQSGNLTRGKLGREPEKGNGLGNLTRKTDTTKYPPWSEEGGAEDEQLNTNTKHQLIANSVSE